MPKASDMPSAETLALINDAALAAVVMEGETVRFLYRSGLAMEAFDAEVNPLHLPDDDYEAVVDGSGLRSLVDTARRTAGMLSVLERRSGE